MVNWDKKGIKGSMEKIQREMVSFTMCEYSFWCNGALISAGPTIIQIIRVEERSKMSIKISVSGGMQGSEGEET